MSIAKLRTNEGRSPTYWVLALFIVLVFLVGGASWPENQMLIILRPVSLIVCAYGVIGLRRIDIERHRWTFALAGVSFALVLSHLLPLPPVVWQALPGREIIVTIDKAAELQETWRPLSIAPWSTRNALFAMFTPLAVLLLGMRLTPTDRLSLVPLVLSLGIISGLLALLQAAGASGVNFYSIGPGDRPTGGLFANQNHAALFLSALFPLLAVYASGGPLQHKRPLRLWASALVAIVLVPLIIVTGSRAGLVLALVAMLGAVPLLRKPHDDSSYRPRARVLAVPALAVGGLIGIALLTMPTMRANAFDRLMTLDNADELRFMIWGPITKMGMDYFPVGSGVGSFVETYQIGEPFALLRPEYVNHAHNELLELWLTGGIPALVIAFIGTVLVGRRALGAWRISPARSSELRLSRAAGVVLVLFALASLVEYPLRTPSLMVLAIVALLWLDPWTTHPINKSDVQSERGGTRRRPPLSSPAI